MACMFDCFWHLTDKSGLLVFVRFWTIADIDGVSPRAGLSANDPKRTLVVHRDILASARTARALTQAVSAANPLIVENIPYRYACNEYLNTFAYKV